MCSLYVNVSPFTNLVLLYIQIIFVPFYRGHMQLALFVKIHQLYEDIAGNIQYLCFTVKEQIPIQMYTKNKFQGKLQASRYQQRMFSCKSQPIQILEKEFIIPNHQPCNFNGCPFSTKGKKRVCKLHFADHNGLAPTGPRYNFFYCGNSKCSYGSPLAKHFQLEHQGHRFNCGNESCAFVMPFSNMMCGLHYIHKSTCLSQGCVFQEKKPLHLCEKHSKPSFEMKWHGIKGGCF